MPDTAAQFLIRLAPDTAPSHSTRIPIARVEFEGLPQGAVVGAADAQRAGLLAGQDPRAGREPHRQHMTVGGTVPKLALFVAPCVLQRSMGSRGLASSRHVGPSWLLAT